MVGNASGRGGGLDRIQSVLCLLVAGLCSLCVEWF